jgi:hypothetical protein
MSDADDVYVKVFTSILYVEIPLALLVIANLYLAFGKPGGGFVIGYNKIISLLIAVIILAIIVCFILIISLPDTEDDLSTAVVTGMIFPLFLIIVYSSIATFNFFKSSKSTPVSSGAPSSAAPAAPAALTPAAPAKGGGRRHKRSTKSKK